MTETTDPEKPKEAHSSDIEMLMRFGSFGVWALVWQHDWPVAVERIVRWFPHYERWGC